MSDEDKLKKIKLSFDKTSGSIKLPPEEVRRMQESMKKIQEDRKTREKENERRAHISLTVDAGECFCLQPIHYTSSFKFINIGTVMFGGSSNGYWQETITSSCSSCALTYNASHTRFSVARDQIKEKRLPLKN